MAEVLADTDVFVDHLRGARRLERPEGPLAYSVITRAELYAGLHADERVIDRLLAPFRELEADRPVAERAGRIRRQTGIRLADALIAATALEHDLILTTRNVRHFGAVEDLRLAAPEGR